MDLKTFNKNVQSVIRQRRFLTSSGNSPQDVAKMRKSIREFEKYRNYWKAKPESFFKYVKRHKDEFMELIPSNQTKRIEEFNQILNS